MGEGSTRTLIGDDWKMHGLRLQLDEIDAIEYSVPDFPVIWACSSPFRPR
jgi:hypothetical protein